MSAALLPILFTALMVASQGAGPTDSGRKPRPIESDVLCTPRQSLRTPGRCAGYGPAQDILRWTLQDELTDEVIPGTHPDAVWGELPILYRRLPSEGAKIYSSAEAAAADGASYRALPPGFLYVSWEECSILDDTAVYMIAPGAYIRGGSSCKWIALPSFRGLALSRPPSTAFGWILAGVFPLSAPGSSSPTRDRWLERFSTVVVYESVFLDGQRWHRIGAAEWVEDSQIAAVEPDVQPPPGVTGERWISLDLGEQTLAVYEGGRLAYATLISSGSAGTWTRPGTFQIVDKLVTDDMDGSYEADGSDYYYLEDVPWVMYFDGARAIHGAYWHNGFGYPRSHGCVNLSPTDAHWLFEWADVGTWVFVTDSSGRTPVEAFSPADQAAVDPAPNP